MDITWTAHINGKTLTQTVAVPALITNKDEVAEVVSVIASNITWTIQEAIFGENDLQEYLATLEKFTNCKQEDE